jgi:hypothetical protein
MVDRRFRSTRRKTNGIPNIAWKERQCAAHIGIPKPRFSVVPGLGIQTLLTGEAFWLRLSDSASFMRWPGERAFTPSTPAVFFPWLSCVTLRTARHLADQEFISNRCSL